MFEDDDWFSVFEVAVSTMVSLDKDFERDSFLGNNNSSFLACFVLVDSAESSKIYL